jgi:hypothetical protein
MMGRFRMQRDGDVGSVAVAASSAAAIAAKSAAESAAKSEAAAAAVGPTPDEQERLDRAQRSAAALRNAKAAIAFANSMAAPQGGLAGIAFERSREEAAAAEIAALQAAFARDAEEAAEAERLVRGRQLWAAAACAPNERCLAEHRLGGEAQEARCVACHPDNGDVWVGGEDGLLWGWTAAGSSLGTLPSSASSNPLNGIGALAGRCVKSVKSLVPATKKKQSPDDDEPQSSGGTGGGTGGGGGGGGTAPEAPPPTPQDALDWEGVHSVVAAGGVGDGGGDGSPLLVAGYGDGRVALWEPRGAGRVGTFHVIV